jgi:hypothetical protein
VIGFEVLPPTIELMVFQRSPFGAVTAAFTRSLRALHAEETLEDGATGRTEHVEIRNDKREQE